MLEIKHSILGVSYTVKIGLREEIDLDDDRFGECREYSKVIKISTDLEDFSEEEMKVRVEETLAHELLHGYFAECGLRVDEEEKVCEFYMRNFKRLHNSIKEIYQKWLFDRSTKVC